MFTTKPVSFLLQQFIERRIALALFIRVRGCPNSPVFECDHPMVPRTGGYRGFANHLDTNRPSIPASNQSHPKHLRPGDASAPYGLNIGTRRNRLNDEFAIVG